MKENICILNPLISFKSSKTEDIPHWTSLIGGVTMQKVHQTIMMCNGTDHFIAQLQCVAVRVREGAPRAKRGVRLILRWRGRAV